MAIAFVQKLTADATEGLAAATTNVTTTNVNHTAGNAIILAISATSTIASITSVVDSAGNTYVSKRRRTTTGIAAELWASNGAIALPSGGTITVTWNASTASVTQAIEVSGISVTEDAETDAVGNSNSPAGTITTVATNTIVISDMGAATLALSGNTTNSGVFSSVCDRQHSISSVRLNLEYLIKASAGVTNWAETIAASARWVEQLVSFPESTPAAGVKLRTLMGVGL